MIAKEKNHNEFPRLINRGPIEAMNRLVTRTAVAEFPRLINRGPIEATGTAFRLWSPGQFPRLINRGPIEAAPIERRSDPHHQDFRG